VNPASSGQDMWWALVNTVINLQVLAPRSE
jgi:hypothetical protein